LHGLLLKFDNDIYFLLPKSQINRCVLETALDSAQMLKAWAENVVVYLTDMLLFMAKRHENALQAALAPVQSLKRRMEGELLIEVKLLETMEPLSSAVQKLKVANETLIFAVQRLKTSMNLLLCYTTQILKDPKKPLSTLDQMLKDLMAPLLALSQTLKDAMKLFPQSLIVSSMEQLQDLTLASSVERLQDLTLAHGRLTQSLLDSSQLFISMAKSYLASEL
jgi:hypothetical protein